MIEDLNDFLGDSIAHVQEEVESRVFGVTQSNALMRLSQIMSQGNRHRMMQAVQGWRREWTTDAFSEEVQKEAAKLRDELEVESEAMKSFKTETSLRMLLHIVARWQKEGLSGAIQGWKQSWRPGAPIGYQRAEYVYWARIMYAQLQSYYLYAPVRQVNR